MKNRIVLIEDNFVLLECYYQILTKFGFDVLALDNISDYSVILNFNPDLIISDLFLGYGNDNSIIDFFNNCLGYKNIPVILVTGNSEFSFNMINNIDLIGEVLIKPISIETLINSVKKYL